MMKQTLRVKNHAVWIYMVLLFMLSISLSFRAGADPADAASDTDTPAAEQSSEADEKDILQMAIDKQYTGLLDVDGTFYYLTKGEVLKKNWKKSKGNTYYFTASGKACCNISKMIKGKYWIFDKESRLSVGEELHVQKIKGVKYLVRADGSAPGKGWQTYNNRKYWAYADGMLVKGIKKIKGHYYYFDEKCRLGTSKENRVVTYEGTDYLVKTSGELGSGWCEVGSKFCYCKANGKLLKDTTKDKIKINKKGFAKTRPMTALEKKAYQVVSSITSPGMSKGQKITACWNYITSHANFTYRAQYDPNAYTTAAFQRLALLMLNIRGGNCYGFAAGFAALTKAAGCTSYVIYGLCPGTRDRRPDGLTRHGWVYISGYGYFDPEGEYAGFAHIYGAGSCPWIPQGQLLI